MRALAALVSVIALVPGCYFGMTADQRAYALAHQAPEQIGSVAPPVNLPGVALEDGKVNLVMFWATWSAPDKAAAKAIQDLHVRDSAKGLLVSAVLADDTEPDIPVFRAQLGVTFPVAWDAKHDVAPPYHPVCEPSIYITDRSRVIRFIHCGWQESVRDDMQREIESLL